MNTHSVLTVFKKVFAAAAVLNISLLALIMVVIVSYLWHINRTTQLGLTQRNLTRQQRDIAEEYKDLQLEVAQFQSISNLQQRIDQMALVPVTDMAYIAIDQDSSVAKR